MKKIKFYCCTLCLFFAFCSPAFAYLDPGSASIVLQAVLAAIAGVIATYKLWLFKVRNFLGKIKKKIIKKN
tara:strand:+ start:1209 stop:1421 length:213 start_codon:yes stop_codon:yes gene_type:complete